VFTQANLERAFGGVLRNFSMGGTTLHSDRDSRTLTVLTDDERPLVLYGDQHGVPNPSTTPAPDK
jgi:manganese/iron transport system ATP-binding protein